MLINSWKVTISASNINKDSEKFYEERHKRVIQIHSNSRIYTELEESFEKLQNFENGSTNQEGINQEEIKSAVAR